MYTANKMQAWCIAEQSRHIAYAIGGFLLAMIDSDFIDQRQPIAEMIDLSQIGTQMLDFGTFAGTIEFVATLAIMVVPVLGFFAVATLFRRAADLRPAVILDLGLPGLNGVEILRRWRAQSRDFPVLVLTARGAWADYLRGEWTYVVLSLVAKSALAWQVFAGTLAG